MLGLNLAIEGVIDIGGDFYVKTPQALEELLSALKEQGYTIKDLRQADYRKRDNIPIETMEKNGWSLWYAHLADIRRGKCGSCGSYISTKGIQSHGHKCEVCEAVTYYNLIDGSTVRFEFIDPNTRGEWFSPEIVMKVQRWDAEAGTLYLYPTPVQSRGLSVVTGEKAEAYLAEHADKWRWVTIGDLKLIAIHYPDDMFVRPDNVISMMETSGHYRNHTIVKVWEDKEYKEYFDPLPIPESLSIYEAWHWAPLQPSPTLHERLFRAVHQVSDQGYYYQDGRPAFKRDHFREIGKFIRHLTTLDPDLYDQESRRFRLSGPGGITDLAQFCHSAPQITNAPNIGNTLVAVGKILGGQSLTPAELIEAARGSHDPRAHGLFGDSLESE